LTKSVKPVMFKSDYVRLCFSALWHRTVMFRDYIHIIMKVKVNGIILPSWEHMFPFIGL